MDQSSDDPKTGSGESPIGLGYARLQIARALLTHEEHEEADTRERARQKILKWQEVIQGMFEGTLDVGSRTPLAGVPAWATPEVITGGFATGRLLAGGPLQEHECAWLARFPEVPESHARGWLHGSFLTDEGFDRLQEFLLSGCYDVTVPEEGALLVITWLARNGHGDAARNLLQEIAPWFDRLRFYPAPASRPRQSGTRVFLQDVDGTVRKLKAARPNLRILAQREAALVWTPLYDRAVRLFLETVEGETPDLQRDADGSWARSEDGHFPVIGGWPCRHYPQDWQARAAALVGEVDALRKTHDQFRRRPERKDSLAQLCRHLRTCSSDPALLSGREVGRIRLILARSVASHGAPDSGQRRELRERQVRDASQPTFREISEVVVSRLATHPGNRGIDDLSGIVQPVSEEDANPSGIPPGTPVPPSIQRKVRRCLCETVENLVEQRIVTSGETLARVLPQMTADIRAAGITDPSLRRLLAAIYSAFRRRRSLLLLNLESQVRFEELPWVAAIDSFRSASLSDRELARQTLRDVTLLTVTSFPQAILPNKLLQELQALAKTAEMDLPLVEEIAADIFMGRLTEKFHIAAQRTAKVLDGSLYATYYGIDWQKIVALPTAKPGIIRQAWMSWSRRDPVTDPLIRICEARAGVTFQLWKPAISGMILEQVQILTSHNLAVLSEGLDLAGVLKIRQDDLARRCFAWICQRLQRKVNGWHADLIRIKNTAYAWRQMNFFLSLLPAAEVAEFLRWAEDHLSQQSAEFKTRFEPALRGLTLAAAGHSPEGRTAERSGARRFLGWSTDRHWLLAAASPDGRAS